MCIYIYIYIYIYDYGIWRYESGLWLTTDASLRGRTPLRSDPISCPRTEVHRWNVDDVMACAPPLRMVVPSVSAVFRFPFCRFTVLPFRHCARSFPLPVSVSPFQPTQRFEDNVFRFAGHIYIYIYTYREIYV